MSEKTILKLYANGDLETFVPVNQSKNLYEIVNSKPGYIYRITGSFENPAQDARYSAFIPVIPGETYTFQAWWDKPELIPYERYGAWSLGYYYDSNFLPISKAFETDSIRITPVVTYHTSTIVIPNGVAYIGLSANLVENQNGRIQFERGDASPYSLSLKDLQEIDSSGVIFREDAIIVPSIVKYDNNKIMPSWVKDTGQPISIFKEGVVIKGELIETDTSVLFKDDFNRADSNTLGDNWTNGRGSFGIENSTARGNGAINVSNVVFCSQPHGDNVSISADIKGHVSESIVFRAVDASNHLYVQFERGDLKLKSVENGTVSTLKTVYLGASSTRFYRTRVELRGAEIKVYVDDTLQITHETNAYLNNNKCGIQSWSGDATNGRIDNFEIKKLI